MSAFSLPRVTKALEETCLLDEINYLKIVEILSVIDKKDNQNSFKLIAYRDKYIDSKISYGIQCVKTPWKDTGDWGPFLEKVRSLKKMSFGDFQNMDDDELNHLKLLSERAFRIRSRQIAA